MKCIVLIIVAFLLGNTQIIAQIENVPNSNKFFNLNDALLTPEKVISLDLSNQNLIWENIKWEVFTNLEYLSLKNDNLTTIPDGIMRLSKLKSLDLSGNYFKTLPKTMKGLSRLEVLFLNDEKEFDLENSINVLSDLPNLKELHLENDNLKTLPKKFDKLKQLESLYLTNNKFIELPKPVMSLKHLQYLDLRKNNIDSNLQDLQNLNFGFKIDLK
jgi:Leucine-rich repeat (LRR) protein